MSFDLLHIHKTKKASFENLLFLAIPILVFVAVLAFVLTRIGP